MEAISTEFRVVALHLGPQVDSGMASTKPVCCIGFVFDDIATYLMRV